MNKFSLRKLGAEAGANLQQTKPTMDNTDHYVFRLHSGRALPIIAPPSWEESDQFSTQHASPADAEFVEKYPSTTLANRAIRARLRMDHGVTEIRENAHPAVAPSLIAPIIAEHVKAIVAQAAPLSEIARSLEARDAALYVVPGATDIESRMDDDEIRRDYRAMTTAQRASLREAMATGREDRAALALRRSPRPVAPEDAQAADAAWRAQVASAHPAKAKALADERAHYEIDAGNVRQMLHSVDYPEVDRKAVAEALRAADAEGFFNVAQAAA